MPFDLTLTLDYYADTEWRWVLEDPAGRFLADYEVHLDPADPLYAGFVDLPRHLQHFQDVRPAREVLAELGEWMGRRVFGPVGDALLDCRPAPACIVQVRVPPQAQNLLFRPFELAHLEGVPLAERGIRFIYTVARPQRARRPLAEKATDKSLRLLAVFSLPHDASPLNLRRERYQLQKQVYNFVRTRQRAVELRLLQYGATRRTLAEALQEGAGWDVVHFSGHGLQGELLLEQPDGRADRIDADELARLLRPAAARLKLITLSACYSGAADVRAARAQVGLDNPPHRQGGPPPASDVLPSLGQRLAQELDCAVLAMRYPVLDDFATELTLALYDRLLDKGQPLPAALQLALDEALHPRRDPYRPGFSRITPLLFGPRAADLKLPAPKRPADFQLPRTGLIYFPPPPERFVGRLRPMLRASQALAPESDKRGVLFYGMAGAGKTACALELAYRYDPQHLERFSAFVWYKAPDETTDGGGDIAGELTNLALALENQLPGLELVGLLDDPATLRRRVLPRLRALLQNNAILLVLDNLEGLLTSRGEWRDRRWGELLAALLDHNGPSRLILTSRRRPRDLIDHPRLQTEAIHALSFPESVLLARQLPHLAALFRDEAGRERLRRILAAAQGHPKLLELADALAADPAALAAQLARAGAGEEAALAFFEGGESDREADAFVAELRRWTEGVFRTLPPTAQLLAWFLARLEEADRTRQVVEANWEDFLRRLTGERGGEGWEPAPEPAPSLARAALSEPELGLPAALERLARAGLIEIEIESGEGESSVPTAGEMAELLTALAAGNPELAALLEGMGDDLTTLLQGLASGPLAAAEQVYRLHPGVAEALRAICPQAVQAAADIELGDYFLSMFYHGLRTEMEGGGRLVTAGARRAAPYLLRRARWDEAASALEQMLRRDRSPAAVALALPLLRRIAAETRGTERELIDEGKLAYALLLAGRYAEAEAALRDLLDRCRAQGEYRLASGIAGQLFNLLLMTGRYEAALATAEEQAEYTRRAGLGPWTQLLAERARLDALNALGRYEEVLAAVEERRQRLRDLPETGDAEEAVEPWHVREVLLHTGLAAAVRLERWAVALALNAERVEYQRRRGADAVELARTRFNDYGPLLRLGRYDDARALLGTCRDVYTQAGYTLGLGRVYSALADLADQEGRPAEAARFEETALRYKYRAGQPEDCAISHNNLANYLTRSGGPPETALVHRLAAGLILLQTRSGQLAATLRNLALSSLPPEPPSFDEVCDRVEAVAGVYFRALFAQLPAAYPDGDAALRQLWAMVGEERARVEGVLTVLPSAVQESLQSGDLEGALAALAQLPPDQQQAVMAALEVAVRQMGFDPEQEAQQQQLQQVLAQFEPLLQAMAAVALGDDGPRAEIEALLPQLEANGWRIAEAVRRVWSGERDAAALTAGLDEQDTALVRRLLELVAS